MSPHGRTGTVMVVGAVAMGVAMGAAQSAGISFENVARKAGLTSRLVSGTPSKMFLIESTTGGAAFTDYDNDGWVDLYLINGSMLEDERRGRRRESNRLYRNNRDGTFSDVTQAAGVGGLHWGMGVCTGDVDNNGFDDLYVTNVGANLLYLNQGDGTFRETGKASGVDHTSWSSSCAFADYDHDGDLDLYVSAYMLFDVMKPQERANDG